MPDEFLQEGLDIWYKAKVLREFLVCGLDQTKLEILEISEVIKKPWHVRYLSDYPNRTTSFDMFSIDTAYVDGDSLRMNGLNMTSSNVIIEVQCNLGKYKKKVTLNRQTPKELWDYAWEIRSDVRKMIRQKYPDYGKRSKDDK